MWGLDQQIEMEKLVKEQTAIVKEAEKETLLTIRASDAPYRLVDEGETFEEYKERRRVLKSKIKQHCKGRLFFISKHFNMPNNRKGATYNKRKESEKLLKKYGKHSEHTDNRGNVLPILPDTPKTNIETEGKRDSDTGTVDVLQQQVQTSGE